MGIFYREKGAAVLLSYESKYYYKFCLILIIVRSNVSFYRTVGQRGRKNADKWAYSRCPIAESKDSLQDSVDA